MNIVTQKLRAVYNIACHLWRNRVVITNPLSCSRLFMERTAETYRTTLRFGSMRFVARKEDMNAVTEVLVGGGYDTMIPYLRSIPHPPVVLDCGANIGSFGLRVLKERPDARIVSIEAAEDTFAILSGNQAGIAAAWDTVHAALWESDGHLVLSRSENSVMHTVRTATAEDSDTIPSRSLPSIKEQFGLNRVDILKMDIEGAETTVIPAAPEEMEAGMVIIEIHKMLGDPTMCCEILSKIYPYAFVCPDQLHAPEFPNVVYYLYKEKIDGAGMVAVDLMDHLRSVYDPQMWPTS
jgi:FkbM family methyltransferase